MKTAPGAGTSFRIRLPLMVTTFRGVVVRAAGTALLVPTSHVERAVRIRRDDLKTVENRETVSVAGETVAFARLGDILELENAAGNGADTEPSEHIPALVLRSAEQRIAIGVDEVLGEQEGLLKQLGKQLSRVRNVSGVAVLGSSKLIPVLNPSDLFKTAALRGGAPTVDPEAAEPGAAGGKSVLVVEDSITSRMLLKSILEAGGYRVRVAVDGEDAFAVLRTEDFDLVVSDVDMPRMDGFVLTSRIRSDKKLTETPVVLVTALEPREDRERGIDVGADAYIVKSSFAQSNLLDVVAKLM